MRPGPGTATCLLLLWALVWETPDDKQFDHICCLFISRGCLKEHLSLLTLPQTVFDAFPSATFGWAEYRWDDATDPIERVLSVMDCFVTLMEPALIPSVLAWDPITHVKKPVNWQAGSIHHAAHQWEDLPGCSKWVLEILAPNLAGPLKRMIGR